MSMFENVQAEEALLKFIVQKQDISLLSTINADWLTGTRHNLLNVLRLKDDCMEMFYCTSFCEENNIDVDYPLINRVFKTEITEELQSVRILLEEKYLKRQVYAAGEYILDNIKKKHPLIISSEVEERLKGIRYVGKPVEKLGDTFEPDTMDLVDCGIQKMQDLVLSKEEIMVLGGERGHHKTNFALYMARKALERNVIDLKDETFKVLILSKEMPFKVVKARIIASLFGIPFKDVRRGNYNQDEIHKIFHEKFWYYHDNLIVIPPESIRNPEDVAKFILQESPTIWIFDYMQLLARSMAGKDGDVDRVIAWLVTSLKGIAQSTKTLGVLISTLKKFNDNRINHIPRLEDLYSSVEIQYLASWVGLCYWSWFYNRDLRQDPFFVLWEKNRNDEPYTMALKVFPEYSNFDNLITSTLKMEDYLK